MNIGGSLTTSRELVPNWREQLEEGQGDSTIRNSIVGSICSSLLSLTGTPNYNDAWAAICAAHHLRKFDGPAPAGVPRAEREALSPYWVWQMTFECVWLRVSSTDNRNLQLTWKNKCDWVVQELSSYSPSAGMDVVVGLMTRLKAGQTVTIADVRELSCNQLGENEIQAVWLLTCHLVDNMAD